MTKILKPELALNQIIYIIDLWFLWHFRILEFCHDTNQTATRKKVSQLAVKTSVNCCLTAITVWEGIFTHM